MSSKVCNSVITLGSFFTILDDNSQFSFGLKNSLWEIVSITRNADVLFISALNVESRVKLFTELGSSYIFNNTIIYSLDEYWYYDLSNVMINFHMIDEKSGVEVLNAFIEARTMKELTILDSLE